MNDYDPQAEQDRKMEEFDNFIVNGVFFVLFLALFLFVMPRVLDFIFIDEKYVTTETVLAPGDLAIRGTSYVGVVGNTVEFEAGDKTLKYTFEEGKKIKLGEDRSVVLKKISGDGLKISEKRLVRVNKFNDEVLDGK